MGGTALLCAAGREVGQKAVRTAGTGAMGLSLPKPPPHPCCGTHRVRREISWLKVSAPTSQMRLCCRPLGQERWVTDGPCLHSTPPHPGQKKGEPCPPPSPWDSSELKGAQSTRLPRVSGSGDKAINPSLWPKRESVSCAPTVPGSPPHRSCPVGPPDPGPASEPTQPLVSRDRSQGAAELSGLVV